jgi:hypothetical protein
MAMYGKVFPFDPVVVDWAQRVVSNGGADPSILTKIAATDFLYGLRLDAIYSKMMAVNIYAPDNLSASITPLIRISGSSPWINHNFVSGDLNINGLAGDASSKFLDTGLVPSASFTTNFAGVSLYAFDSTGTGFDYGCYGPLTTDPVLIGATKHTDHNAYSYDGDNNLTNVTNQLSSGSGFYTANRISTTDHKLYFAHSSQSFIQFGATDATSWTNTGYPNTNFYVHGEQLVGLGLQFPSSTRISFMAIHLGLTSSEAQKLFNRVQTLRKSLRGGFV